jgi:Zn-dependent M28 family amino/carboxypeptidase
MSSWRRPRSTVAVLAAACVGLGLAVLPASAGPAAPAGPKLAQQLTKAVTLDAMNRHLVAFQRLSDRNGGNRAPGTPGHRASADYVTGKLTDAGFTVTAQDFPVRYSAPLAERFVVGGTAVTMHMALYTPNTPVGGITGRLAVPPDDPTHGCDAADYASASYTGTVVLVRRGGCTFAVKQQAAAAAGAIATIIYNTADTWLRASLVSEADARIPTGGVSRSIGEGLLAKVGQQATVELRTLTEMRTSRTIIAQTKTGRANNVVMAGAHLDSVVEGAGVGTNGTGAAALLETALKLGPSPKVNNAVRFVFWGAWEFGIVSAPYYLEHLTFEQQLDIALYLNMDGIAAPNAGYFVYDGDTGPYGSTQIEGAFADYLAAVGTQTERIPLPAMRSDHLPFLTAGIPSGGVFTGNQDVKTAAQATKWGGTAGIPFDACYHEACDNLGNVDRAVLDRNADALAWVTASYAMSTEGVNGVPARSARAAKRAPMTRSADVSNTATR